MKYRKKPVVIDAELLTKENYMELMKWSGSTGRWDDFATDEGGIVIPTREGNHQARWGDYIIKGVKGEFYPCKPDIFEMTYEKV